MMRAAHSKQESSIPLSHRARGIVAFLNRTQPRTVLVFVLYWRGRRERERETEHRIHGMCVVLSTRRESQPIIREGTVYEEIFYGVYLNSHTHILREAE